jgi:hypothetical protein
MTPEEIQEQIDAYYDQEDKKTIAWFANQQ